MNNKIILLGASLLLSNSVCLAAPDAATADAMAKGQNAITDAQIQVDAAHKQANDQIAKAKAATDANRNNMTAEQQKLVDQALKDAEAKTNTGMAQSAQGLKDAKAQMDAAKVGAK